MPNTKKRFMDATDGVKSGRAYTLKSPYCHGQRWCALQQPPQDTVYEQLAASQRKAPRHMLPLSIDGSNFRSLKMNGEQKNPCEACDLIPCLQGGAFVATIREPTVLMSDSCSVDLRSQW